jgi:FkbM family methyltransferase
MTPDTSTPFGSFPPSGFYARLLALSQGAPHNVFGQQLAGIARDLYLWRAPVPADLEVGDLKMRCYLRDNTCERKFVFTPWRFDPKERAALAAALPPEGVFVDIGANVGLYTLLAATAMHTRGRIVALEPYLPAYQRLCFNIAATRAGRADWPRIDALQVGVADAAQSRGLTIDPGNLGGSSMAGGGARYSRAGAGATVRVSCRPLLEILDDLGIARLDAIKIDIEGAEDMALCPFLAQAPAQLLPRRVVVENSDHLWKTDLRAALAARGFSLQLRTRLNSVYAR